MEWDNHNNYKFKENQYGLIKEQTKYLLSLDKIDPEVFHLEIRAMKTKEFVLKTCFFFRKKYQENYL